MKKYLLLLLPVFFVVSSYAQNGIGFGVGFSTSKAPMLAVKYFLNKNAVSIGGSYQAFNNALGSKKEFIPGTFAIGDGTYFYSIDLGYSRELSEKIAVSGELSIGTKKTYQNFSDNDLSAGGYHRIIKSESKVGVGGIIIYNINDLLGVFVGYNSLREADFGVQIKFVR